MSPSGSDPETVSAIYSGMLAQYMERIPVDKTETVWTNAIYAAIFAVALIGFFFALSFLTVPLRGRHLELLELTEFNGQLSERVALVRRFQWLVWSGTTLWAAYFALKAMAYGIAY